MEKLTNEQMTQIHNDLPVFDAAGEEIGKVTYVQIGDEDPHNFEVEVATDHRAPVDHNSFVEDLADVFTPEINIPEEMIARMRRYGFIRIDTGLLRSDRFALADQIAHVRHDRVTLNVRHDELLKS